MKMRGGEQMPQPLSTCSKLNNDQSSKLTIVCFIEKMNKKEKRSLP